MTWDEAQRGTNVTYSQWLTHEIVSDALSRREDEEGSAGVREPRRPVQPSHSGGAALALPRHDDAPPAYLTTIGGF